MLWGKATVCTARDFFRRRRISMQNRGTPGNHGAGDGEEGWGKGDGLIYRSADAKLTPATIILIDCTFYINLCASQQSFSRENAEN